METDGVAVTKLMTSDLTTVGPDTDIEDAADVLLAEGIGSLVVVEDGELVGMLTSTDFVGIVSADGGEPTGTVAEYMTSPVVTVAADDSVPDAAAKMITNDVQHLPVEDDDGVVGMLSTTDLTVHLSYKQS